MIKERNLALCIILSLCTCGIYSLYWYVCLTDDTNTAAGTDGPSGVLALVLTLVTCGIYNWYWAYKQGEKIATAQQSHGQPVSDNKILYLILCLFGLGIVAWVLMQNELNKMATPAN
ncbi:MAG: DUF4234 domain-containing protein [Lachnoclostridium sp.]|nr:DUF4234 domain-containing protein [Lachnospira sp.]MCM1247465.1 DUF4234 domain-containing protein [Lachnoclostridium sp.]MCM1327702.1 DUF4234 domain-containing protein [Lachnoclostridium sp.]MCM1385675.1 DUF4234 domain-containing protein [Lachnoclostridium sp.]MCM1466446.1 DUF4234 domain-containing protein [Bacteroidales bacterium]